MRSAAVFLSTSLFVSLIASLFVSKSNAFEVSGNFWESGQATVHVDISGNSPTGGSWNAAFMRSMDAWTDATDFQFLKVEEYHDPCVENGEGEFGDSITGVDFTETVCGTEYGDTTLAVTLTAGTCFTPACNSFHITDADIVFNEGEPWDIYSGNRRFGFNDFERVALHELGHALGLGHEASNIAMMQSTVSDLDSLQSDDISGVGFIYGGDATFPSIYGVDIILPPVSVVSNPNTSISFDGILTSQDTAIDGKFVDLYQYTFENDSTVAVQASSNELDTFLYLVRVSSTQEIIPDSTFTNDDFSQSSNSRIDQDIQAGTYWVGVSSAGNNEQGSYDVSINAFDRTPTQSFDTYTSIYGVDIEVNPNPSIKGSLAEGDFSFDSAFLDLYQFQVNTPISLSIDLSSANFDTKLLLVEVDENQQPGTLLLEDDDGGLGTDSRIEETLPAGIYWIGATSLFADKTGDYNIEVSVVLP